MYYGYTREERNKAIENKAASYREAANLFPIIRKVINQFDGKCFNCRFEKALQEASGKRIYVKKEYDRFLCIYTYSKNSYNQITLANINLADMPDGKRIPGDLLIESAKDRYSRLLSNAAELESMIEKVDLIETQLKYFKSQIERIVSTIPYEARDIYNLNYHVQTR